MSMPEMKGFALADTIRNRLEFTGLLVDADERFDDLRGFYQEHPLYHAPFLGEYS